MSVIVVARDRPGRLGPCIAALARQTAAAGAFEVILSDGRVPARPAGGQPPFPLRVVQGRQPNRAMALNAAVGMAKGSYCLFLGDDVVADQELVERHLIAQRRSSGVIGIGRLRPRGQDGARGLVRYFSERQEELSRQLDSGQIDPDFRACVIGNLSVPTSQIRSIQGFDERMSTGEDVELAYRLERAGLRTVYLADAEAEEQVPEGARAIVGAFDREGASAVAVYRRHPQVLMFSPLGDFSHGWIAAVLLRRLLLLGRAPVWPLGLLEPVLAPRFPVRLYRFIELYCYWRSVRRALGDPEVWRRLTRGTVILMYHAVGRPPERASRFVVPARRFRRQLAWLRLRRRPVLGLDEYVRLREQNELPPSRSVVITFDDGYRDNAELAAPMLRRRGMPATLFVVTGAVGDANRWEADGPLAGRPLLSWDELRRLRALPMAIGAHSVSHPRLPELGPREVEREIVDSRVRLDEELGCRVEHFAYPFGRTSEAIASAVRDAGFASGCGVQPGPNGPAVPVHQLRRLEVWGTHSLLRFALDLSLGRRLVPPALSLRRR